MTNIISIGTAVPQFCHKQSDILHFMQDAFELDDTEKRKLSFLYSQSGINFRYSVLPDFNLTKKNKILFLESNLKSTPALNERLKLYNQNALNLSVDAITNCIKGKINAHEITHLITVSCTGMSAPGLDLEIVEYLKLNLNIFRTSVNFMGCYGAIHAIKIAKLICDSTANANVMIVTTELCTLHFQNDYSLDNAASSLLFGDGSAAILLSNSDKLNSLFQIDDFYSAISFKGKPHMSWDISSKGFLMTLSGYVPQLIKEDISELVENALQKNYLMEKDITHWCIHPGGKKILDTIQKQLNLCDCALDSSRKVLADYGNMSSATILFVLKEIIDNIKSVSKPSKIFGVAFGPGLTMETFIISSK